MTFLRTRTVVALLGVAALVTGCGGGPGQTASGGAAEVGTTSDINATDPATLRDGGDLRLALDEFPVNFNSQHLDGNTADNGTLAKVTMPRAFRVGPDGSTTVNTDYFTSVEQTSTSPQVITYTIDPRAVWSDGTPITWEDIASQAAALSGRDPAYIVAATGGFERVASVTRGVDDRQAVMTFAQPYADWRGMLAGNSVLQPRSATATAAAFNESQLQAPGPSAGPFTVTGIDRTAQRLTLTRNPTWWGAAPRLDSVTFLVLGDAARVPALRNDALDATGLASLEELTEVRGDPALAVRRAPGNSWSHITFNGAPGSILADPALRRAVAKGIDRQAVADVLQRGLTASPTPLDNHIFVAGQDGFQDNSAPVVHDPDAARRELDELGWRLQGDVRVKDGRPLEIRDVVFQSESSSKIAQVVQASLAAVGVRLRIDVKPPGNFFGRYIVPGDFDVATFGWSGDAFPLGGLAQIYASAGPSNFGRIGSPEIDAKISETLAELDPATARVLANEVDALLFDEVFSLPLFQSAGNVGVRADLANLGAPGLADVDWTAVGFTA